jgi:hypothetical protein
LKIPYGPPPPLGREFVELAPDVAAAILRTVTDGWTEAAAHPDVNLEAGEVLMTERLRDGMRRVLKTPDHPWGKSMVVLGGMESRSTIDVMRPDGRTDIPILVIHLFQRLGEHDPHAIIECKRVAGTDAHLCREYVVEGIDRFCTGKYADNHSIGFMVGYVMTGSPDDAASGINAHLNRVRRTSESLQKDQARLHWSSLHPRSSSAIRLHHSFVAIVQMSNN